MKKLLYILLWTFLLINVWVVFSECKISWKIEQCTSALKDYVKKDGSWISPWTSLRSIEDFVCLQDTPEKRAFQIAMWENFSQIDDEMDKYLEDLSTSKNFYFWKDAQYSYLDWINHIWNKHYYFKEKYYSACVSSIGDVIECIKNPAYLPEEVHFVTEFEASEYLENSNWNCYKLTDTKLEIFKEVAYNILLLNKEQVARDEKKLYDQEIRTKYDKVIDLMMINLWYIERVWRKWPSKTKNAY